MSEAIHTINQCDVAIVQHDYGLYGGIDGAEIIELVRELIFRASLLRTPCLPETKREPEEDT